MADLHISEVWRNWAIIAGGGAGLVIAVWRGYAADRQSRASRSQADTARRAHITEVYKDAVGQLNHERLEIRLGAIFTLVRIYEDFGGVQALCVSGIGRICEGAIRKR